MQDARRSAVWLAGPVGVPVAGSSAAIPARAKYPESVLDAVFGREQEVAELARFLEAVPAGPRALVLVGRAGAGKTTLFDTAVQGAEERGITVLEARPAESETPLSFAGLGDLLRPHVDEVLEELPLPLRRALSVALLIEEAPERPPEAHAVAAAVRTALSRLSSKRPVLVAIDDVQWLDAPTADALDFALRRLEGEPVGLLCAERSERDDRRPLGLDRARLETAVVHVGGLSIGALHRLLRTRLDASFSRPSLRRIEADSGGNPFIALELARALLRRGELRLGAETRLVPETVSELVQERLGELPPGAVEVLRVVALTADATVERALAVVDDAAGLDAAVSAGVLEAEGPRLRFSHPLLASAVADAIPPARRRELHAALAAAVSDSEERARHLALGADGPSESDAAELEAAGRQAAARGAPATAAELLELAASLTPPELVEASWRRKLEAADYLSVAGETRAARAVLEELTTSMPPGPERADALARLAWGREDDFEETTRLLDQALEEVGDDPARRADIHLFQSDILAIRGDLDRARAEARLALADAERGSDEALLASALAQVVMFDSLANEPVDDRLLERALELERTAESLRLRTPPSHVAGLYYLSLGRLDEARAAFEAAIARAESEGVEYWRADNLLRLSLTEGRAGNLVRSDEVARLGLEAAEQLGLEQLTSALLYGRGLAALLLGRADEARTLAEEGLDLSRRVGDEAYATSHEALLGFVELTEGDFAAAADRLGALWSRMDALGKRPSAQGVFPNAVEAMIGAGRLQEAREALEKLERDRQDPLAAPQIARCRGALAAAEGDLEGAVAVLEEALRLHAEVPLPLERGRTLLVLGGVLRRLKQRRRARDALGEALETFDRMGARLWAEHARAELARVSGRTPGTDELTESEFRVAELVAEGKTNKEVAAALFLSVRGVEATLSRIYRKLGVRSRTELAGSLRERV